MKRPVWIALLCAALAAVIAGWLLRSNAFRVNAVHNEYQEALEMYHNGCALLKADKIADSEERFNELTVRIEAYKNVPQWEALRPFVLEADSRRSWRQAELLWIEYVHTQSSASGGTIPDAKEILNGYKAFETGYLSISGNAPFMEPAILWRIENDSATSIVWQLVVRWSMEDAKIEDLKPLYDSALVHYKKAMPLAEKTGQDASRYVSQNLDFMTRLGEAMSEEDEQQKPKDPKEGDGEGDQQGDGKSPGRKGLGDFLSKAMAQAKKGQAGQTTGLGKMLAGREPDLGQKFLPLPMKGIGTSRLPVAGTK